MSEIESEKREIERGKERVSERVREMGEKSAAV